MSSQTYEMGINDMPELIRMFEDGHFDELKEIIQMQVFLRGRDALREYGRGMLDAWEQKYGRVEVVDDHHR